MDALALAIIGQIVEQGPAIVVSIAGLSKDGEPDPTPEQIRALKIEKEPEEYFKEGV